jgi:acetyl-CoA C-acetyltransferase
MSIKGKAYMVGVYEHPLRDIPDRSTAQVHAEVAKGALEDAGLSFSDVDAYFCAGDAPGFGAMSMADYMGLKLKHMDSTETGGSSYIVHAGHAAEAIAAGKCKVALITLAGRPLGSRNGLGDAATRTERFRMAPGGGAGGGINEVPEAGYENIWGGTTHNTYGMCAMRHMHDYGTTSEQLAWIKVAASHHAQWNEHAMLREVVTVEEVVNSPMIADPLHRLDCCVISDGGGAVIMAAPEVAKSLKRPLVKVIGHGEAPKGPRGGQNLDLTYSGAVWSGPPAWEESGVKPADIKYASIYDSFTITVLMQLEDLGFCKKGEGGKFVADGNLISGVGKLPFNTDGGGLCNNHPTNRGGITKVIEAVRQARGEAHPKVQVPNCDLVIAHGTGGSLGTRHGAGTLIMERE